MHPMHPMRLRPRAAGDRARPLPDVAMARSVVARPSRLRPRLGSGARPRADPRVDRERRAVPGDRGERMSPTWGPAPMVTLALVLFIAGWHLHRLVDVLRDRRRRRLFEEAEAAAPDFPGTPVVGTVKLYDGDGPDAQL